MKNIKILIALMVVVVFGLVSVSSASAECGPGFTNKKQLIHYYKHNPSAAHGFRKELLAHAAYTGFHADETVLNYLRSPEQRVFNAPAGYQLKFNTECPGGPGHYVSCGGCLLGNMGGLPMLWHCPKSGKCVPILKGYCMNFVCGPPVLKSPPKCKCRKPKKPKCRCHKHHRHHHHKNGPICSNNSGNGTSCGGGPCSNTTVIVGNGNTVNNTVECKEESEKECGCKPPPPPKEHWTEISCTGFEEISGGGSFLVDCAVSDDNGAPISLEAHSNDSNSRVSGINCYSNGGSQTCPSGGIFEFRVSGINDGSSILYSSITATASANGVKATFTSDPYPVDPKNGGF